MSLVWVVIACLMLELSPRHVDRVIDGDTFLLFHVGVNTRESVRVLDVDTPERGQPGFEEAKLFTINWLALGDFKLHTCKRNGFGRYLAVVSRNGVTLADELVRAGLGRRP